jgi:hypothetical protein
MAFPPGWRRMREVSAAATPMSSEKSAPKVTRRRFLRQAVPAALATPLLLSLEEKALAAAPVGPAATAPGPLGGALPGGKIGPLSISRLICGGNLISGYAHSRDLVYVSTLLKHYFTEERIFETWATCERHGINTMVASSSDPRVGRLYQEYVKRGGKIQYIAQINPTEDDLTTSTRLAAEAGAVGAFLLGNLGDKWSREGAAGIARIGAVVDDIKWQGLVAGVAGHALRTPMAVEKAGIAVDYYVKTLHQDSYWSKRRPDQDREPIDNYKVDNYWCMDANETVAFMAKTKRPWIAYKVLAAGAIPPREGFRYAFESGADFALVGMFDFQVASDVALIQDVFAGKLKRTRAWMA